MAMPRPSAIATHHASAVDNGYSKDATMSSSSPITRENVISPSKMKQRSRRRSSLKPSSSSSSRVPPTTRDPAARDSRDDVDQSPPERQSSAHGERKASSGSSSRASSSATPRSSKNRSSQQQAAAAPASADKENREAQSVHSICRSAAAQLNPDELDSPRTKLQKKLLGNLRSPDAALSDLLDVLTDFEQTSHLRRVNACGAIKTLTLHKANQIPLARTRGVVPSITSVLCAVNATEEERTRCINALMHLCVPEENWKLVYLFPQTPEALARNMADKYPQIRYAACLATSFLAKKNRREVVKNRLLMYAMARVLEVDKNGALDRMSAQDKKVFVGARLCVLKMLLHLSKNKDVSESLARTDIITSSLVSVANTMELAANILCVAILTNLTRHPDNAHHLVYRVPNLVNTFVRHVESSDDHAECAKCALYALQNLSCTSNCRQELANTPDLLGNVTKAAFRHDCPEQQISALHTLKNLSDDPFNLVTMTNTPGCTATLLALANNDASSSGKKDGSADSAGSNAMAQYLACDTLATLSHWLLTLSATRKGSKDDDGGDGKSARAGVDMGRRTFKQNTWEAWN